MTISESLKRFRKDFNLSQKSVADSLGIKPQSYVYETKGVIPSAAVIVKLATIYNVSADYLLGLTDKPSLIQTSNNESIFTDSQDASSLESRISKLESDNVKFKSALDTVIICNWTF